MTKIWNDAVSLKQPGWMRSMAALAVGVLVAGMLYLLGAAIALLTTVGLPLGSPGGPAPAGYFIINLGLSALAAALGGRVSARIAQARRHRVVALLALVLAGLALWAFSQPGSNWPRWYPPTLALVGAAGTLVGGRLWPGPERG
ncbi:MAG TPA: hypothetical protein VFS94_09410 [Gemmatimonadales bacterium]|nr:hypothetical protein [Gemmatimonadales bacterium]